MNTERIDTRQHILGCGQQLVASKGFVGVGLAEILASAGVPKGSFYHYFASKEAFGAALLESYFADYLSRVDALFARTDLSGAQRLLTYFERWIDTQCSEDAAGKCLIVKLAAEIADLSDAMRSTMLAGTDSILRRLAGCIAAGQADGSVGSTQAPADAAQWLYGAWLGASLLAKLRRDRSALDAAFSSTQAHLKLN
ncbi:MAG: bacterial regulatory s, tetR family protein [Proteobacteria bacterium]|nr:bacterial regulatory s, tetR family protein [Pseudomonadota bacterium]